MSLHLSGYDLEIERLLKSHGGRIIIGDDLKHLRRPDYKAVRLLGRYKTLKYLKFLESQSK